MDKPFSELRKLQRKYHCPVLIAGDLFNKWNAQAEVINYLLDVLPEDCYAIPGQHDLPFHRISDIKKSAYWTLVKAGKISNIDPRGPRNILLWDSKILRVYAFPWGSEITPLKNPPKKDLNIFFGDRPVTIINLALVHSYIHYKDHKYPGAPKEQSLRNSFPKFSGYDIVVIGDNHKGFLYKPKAEGEPYVLNCGGFLQWKSDECRYHPRIGLILKDGSVKRMGIVDIYESEWNKNVEKVEKIEGIIDAEDFLDSLSSLGESAINFEEALRRAANKADIREPVRNLILEMMETGNG